MRYLPFLLLAACGSSTTSNPSNTGPGVDAPAAATLDCGTVTDATTPADATTAYQCFVDAVDAHREGVTVQWHPVSEEGDVIEFTYRVVSAGIEQTIDDRADGFSGDPGIHVTTCASIEIEPTAAGSVLSPEDCH